MRIHPEARAARRLRGPGGSFQKFVAFLASSRFRNNLQFFYFIFCGSYLRRETDGIRVPLPRVPRSSGNALIVLLPFPFCVPVLFLVGSVVCLGVGTMKRRAFENDIIIFYIFFECVHREAGAWWLLILGAEINNKGACCL